MKKKAAKEKRFPKGRKKLEAKDRVLSKFTTGRTKSIKKRKKTLLVEYKLMNKCNKFVDRRIGERNHNMTADDRVMARFVAQRMKTQKRKQMFNLENDDDVLTHHGRTIADIEKYDTVRSDSEDEDEGNLDAKFVEKAHFGGGLFTKASENKSSHKSTIDQLIAESKRRKAERQMIKDETVNLTEKLDADLKELLPAINSKHNADETEVTGTKPASESYDVLVRQLKFEPVSKPNIQSKTEDSADLINAKERERELRMKMNNLAELDEVEKETHVKHTSADDLDDGLDIEDLGVFDDEGDDEEDGDDAEQSEGEEEESEDGEDEDDQNNKNEDKEDKTNKIINTKSCIVPRSINELLAVLQEKNTSEKIETIKDLLKLQKVHTGVSIKSYMVDFFRVLVQYIDYAIKEKDDDCWTLTNELSPVFFELTQISGDDIAGLVIAMMNEKRESFSENKSDVQEDTLIFLKLVPLLFPTSDYYHPVTTPAAVFMSEILSENSCKTPKSVIKGLFLTTVMLEFVHLSKRYCPEAMNFLRNVLYIAIPNFEDAYPPVHMKNKILVLNSKHKNNKITEDRLKLSFSTLLLEDIPEDDVTKISIIFTTLRILNAFSHLYDEYSATKAIWLPIERLLDLLPTKTFPPCVRSQIENLKNRIETVSKRTMRYLLAQKKRPKALRLYEPNIRPVIDGRSFRTISEKNLEKEKLMRQYKKEKKGAYREIRKDQKLLTRVMISEQGKKDAERKEKVKQIFGWGQSQQSELKRMERKNRYKR